MGKLVRALSEDGSVLCSAIDTTDIVREIERLHQPTPVVTAALGRMLFRSEATEGLMFPPVLAATEISP